MTKGSQGLSDKIISFLDTVTHPPPSKPRAHCWFENQNPLGRCGLSTYLGNHALNGPKKQGGRFRPNNPESDLGEPSHGWEAPGAMIDRYKFVSHERDRINKSGYSFRWPCRYPWAHVHLLVWVAFGIQRIYRNIYSCRCILNSSCYSK